MLMVKSEEYQIDLGRKKLTKEEKRATKKARKLARRETIAFRKRKQAEKKEARELAEKLSRGVRIEATSIYGHEKRGLNRFLKRNNVSKETFFGLIVNLFFSIFEFFGGIISGSAAIMSDAIHDFGDSISLGFAIYFGKKAHRGPDKKYTYGYSRFSVLGVFVTTVILIVGAAFMIYLSIMRILEPSELNLRVMFALSGIGLILNTFATFRTENGRFNVIKAIEKKTYNGVLFEDVVGWIIVLLGTVVMFGTGWLWLDPAMSILISIYLISTAFSSFKKVLELFLEKVPNGESVDVVKYQVLAIPHVKDVHKIHLWSMDGEKLCATMHVVVDGKVLDGTLIENSVENPINIKKEIRKQLRSTGIKEVTLEIETEGESCKK